MGTAELAAFRAQERGADRDEMLEVLYREVRRCNKGGLNLGP